MENRTSALYVYDRICSKESKKREMYSMYGVRRQAGTKQSVGRENPARRSTNTKPNENRRPMNGEHRRADRPMSDDRTMEFRRPPRSFGAAQSRAGSANRTTCGENLGRRPNYKSAETAHAYTYRPGRPTGGAEAVRERPLKLFIDQIVNMFESVSERGRRDEMLAKRQAVARKKFYEHRHAIFTAILLLMIAVGFALIVYSQFFVISDIDVDGVGAYTADAIIEASGIHNGDNLYSFAVGDAESNITFMCPYIKSAEISLIVPNAVSIAVKEDTAVYVAEIYGERLILSAGLRVLGTVDGDGANGLPELRLPAVSYSVAGRVISFADKTDERYIRNVLTEISKSSYFANGEIDLIDLSNEYSITMNVSGKYVFRLGSESDFLLKLRMAEKTMADTKFDKTTPAYIDLTKVGEASVRYDHNLTFN